MWQYAPMRIWPCSTNVTASLSVSQNLRRTSTTGRRLRQKADTASFSHWRSDFLVGTSPMLKSFSISPSVTFILTASCQITAQYRITAGDLHSIATLDLSRNFQRQFTRILTPRCLPRAKRRRGQTWRKERQGVGGWEGGREGGREWPEREGAHPA